MASTFGNTRFAAPFSAALLSLATSQALFAADETLDTVVVTGVRGSQQRTVTDSPAPIDVINSEQLRTIGQNGLKEMLGRLLPSFNVPTINGGGTAFLVRGVSMRGLGGDQVLILVNGKRRHNSALINNGARVGNASVPVDLDLIPTASIERIEVLRDGAAAQYGSDAIAGVINIILKRNAEGLTSDTSLGQYYDGDGTTGHEAANWGSKLGESGGFFNLSFDGKVQEPYERAAAASGQLYFNQPDGSPDPRESNRHGWGGEYGLGRDRTSSLAYNLELPLQDDLKLYSFSTLSYRNSNKDLGHRKPTDITSLAGVPDAPYPNGGQARREIHEVDFQFAGGAKGLVGNWDWDLSSTYGKDRAVLDTANNLNISNGPYGQHDFHLGNLIFDQWTTNLDFSRALDIGWSSPLETSFGVEHRWEKYALEAGEPNSYNFGSYVPSTGPFAGRVPDPGLFSVNGTTPEDAYSLQRHSDAAYVDLGLNVTPKWYVGAAARYEKYNLGVGETASGKLTTRYEFLPGYAVRAAVSNGFRAPSLAQSVFSTTSTVTQFSSGTTTNVRTKQMRPDSPEGRALGAKDLEPETSRNYSIGLTAEPAQRLRLTADFYLIDIDKRILQTGILKGPAVSQILVDNGLSPNLAGQYYANAADTRTKGVDLVADYSQSFGEYGSAKWSVAYNRNKTTIRSLADTPAALASLGSQYVLFDRQQQLDLTKATPKDKWILSGNYKVGDWTTNLQFTRFGEYTEGANSPADDRTYSAKWITDLDVAYDVTQNLTVAVGANNLFDVYPDKIGLKAWAGTYEYGMFSPYGLGGGYYYSRISLAF
ncbi:TonB-dependent receptor [Pseudomonas gingeri NCPPB 3146 = LMG 5327]|uniref:TonB-dependent receptor n=4 Tax=Pseudomonas gingeri TaxID=117681 RepID=A0A7Y7Y2C5_9PSED|nr:MULTISPECIES: TonB-dependent receptor [Pseudomonas]NVZ29790.1 TonB-dependent receptor [Pseudomonas gingeri]NWA10566.1 TonB-dependent receptor [Pseudomonas gingeri]NWC16653.1 TonB-dependent receptor [Pseudomonas gingeri]NWE49322.1 TonB-dependent receptor [Pseudomonas gingeri]NWE70997.1 TonB-dependent receptor [Pseudomonas gingeri]